MNPKQPGKGTENIPGKREGGLADVPGKEKLPGESGRNIPGQGDRNPSQGGERNPGQGGGQSGQSGKLPKDRF